MKKWLQSVYADSSSYMLVGQDYTFSIYHQIGHPFDAVFFDKTRTTDRFVKRSFTNLADAKAWCESEAEKF